MVISGWRGSIVKNKDRGGGRAREREREGRGRGSRMIERMNEYPLKIDDCDWRWDDSDEINHVVHLIKNN